jgi:hypothetical protein
MNMRVEGSYLEGTLVRANQMLEETRTREAEAGERLEAAAARTIEVRQLAAARQAKADRHATDRAAWIERYSREIEEHFTAGSNGPAPAPVVNAELVEAQLMDEANAAATAAALKRFEAAEQAARDELAARSAVTGAAEKAVKDAEGDVAAESFELACAQVLRAGTKLSRYHGSSPDTPLNQFTPASPRLRRALECFSVVKPALVDDRVVPLNELRRATAGIPAPAAELPEAQENAVA